jgi:hypothetical protein
VTDDRSAALLVRVWLEDGAEGFRARLTSVGAAGDDDDRTVAVAGSPGELLDALSQWLDGFLTPGTVTD